MEAMWISKNGEIALGSNGDTKVSWIYSFVHDTNEPHCNHFDNQLPVTLHGTKDEPPFVSFTKQYTYNKASVNLQHQVQKTNFGYSWEIKRVVQPDELHPCRFGITIPLGTFNIEDKDGDISTSIINYQQQWRNKYVDQTNIDLPIIRIKGTRPIIICTPITDNIQLFKFKDGDSECLKISTQSGNELSLTVHIMREDDRNLKKIYCDVFPDSKSYVYQAELLKRKIHSKYGIRVLSHEIFHFAGVVSHPSENEELEYYMKLLEENLSFYPAKIFQRIGLKNISLCGHLENESDLIKGVYERGGILLSSSEKLGYSLKCRAIHHEIFHMIEHIVLHDVNEKFKSFWNELPSRDSFTDHFKANKSIEQQNEYRCEMFATFILDPRFVMQLADSDPVVQKKLDTVKLIFGKLGPEYYRAIHSHDEKTENTLVPIFKKPQKSEPIQIRKRLLAGIKHSCLPGLIKVLKNDQDFLMIDDSFQMPQKDLAYVTINPLDFCAIEYEQHQIPVEDSFEKWITIHTKLESSREVLRLRSEDVLKFNLHIVRDFLEGVEAVFEVDDLWEVKGEIRPYKLSSIPFLKKMWNLFRNNPIVERVGYSDILCEE